jgi:hypothetical protein
MNLADRLAAFKKLGKYLGAIDEVALDELCQAARNENSWFTKSSVKTALSGLARFLDPKSLESWIANYPLSERNGKTVAVVMAGNIPLVGFHDLLCVLVSGHAIQIKPSSKDTVLLKFIIRKLTEIEPRLSANIQLADQLKKFDAVIATGSDNSSRYFEYYFGKYPHVIRKNRSSCAVLTGFESDQELHELGKDFFTYFGLGCRNISKIFIPEGFQFERLLTKWIPYNEVMMHHKYHNNYDYQKSILLVNKEPFLDAEFVLLQESEKLVSPISVLYYEYYSDWESLVKKLGQHQDKIQCIVGNVDIATVKIGQTQTPALGDYADRVDIMKFLEGLHHGF